MCDKAAQTEPFKAENLSPQKPPISRPMNRFATFRQSANNQEVPVEATITITDVEAGLVVATEEPERKRSLSGPKRIAETVSAVLYGADPIHASTIAMSRQRSQSGLIASSLRLSKGGRIRNAVANVLSTN